MLDILIPLGYTASLLILGVHPMPNASTLKPTHKKAQKVFATHTAPSPKGAAAKGIAAANAPAEQGTIKRG